VRTGSRRRQCPARRIPRIVPALHQFGDVVEIEPGEQRHGGRHEKEHAGEQPEAGHDRHDRVEPRPGKADQQRQGDLHRDHDEDEQGERQAERLPEHLAHAR
jgi:hypothetical protein